MAKSMRLCLDGYQFGSHSRKFIEGQLFQGREASSFFNVRKSSFGKLKGVRAKFGHVTCAFATNAGIDQIESKNDGRNNNLAIEELDHWLQQSVPEIVKNIGNAPLLVQVYKENGSESSAPLLLSSSNQMKLVVEKATAKSWPVIKQRWESNSYTIPNGIILVEELVNKDSVISTNQQQHQDKTNSLECSNIGNNNNNSSSSNICNKQLMESSSPGTRLWDVLVQGRGVNFPTCYVLKTCQVQCCFGLTTHFSLAKVDCFSWSVVVLLARVGQVVYKRWPSC